MINSLETATHAAGLVLPYPLRWQFSVQEYDAAFVIRMVIGIMSVQRDSGFLFILRDLFV